MPKPLATQGDIGRGRLENMQEALRQLTSTPGVVGACVVSESHVVARALPPIIQDAVVMRVCRESRMLRRAVDTLGLESRFVVFTTTLGKVVLFPISQEHCLFICCTSKVNCELVMMTITVSIPELKELISLDATATMSRVQVRTAQEPPTPPTPVASNSADIDEGVALGIQTALAEFLGPASVLLFKRQYKRWRTSGESLDQLVERLAKELDDDQERQRFRWAARRAIGI